jgi:hypothetical protein
MRKITIPSLVFVVFAITIMLGRSVHAAREEQVSASKTPTSAQSTPTYSSTPSLTPSETPTTTLMPLPEITLIFPLMTATSTSSKTPQPPAISATPIPATEELIFPLSPRLRILAILVILLWIFLAGFSVIFIRQLR